MINYYITKTGKRFLKIDDSSVDATFLVINGDTKAKSDITNPETYNKFLEELKDTEYWFPSDEATFNTALAQIP